MAAKALNLVTFAIIARELPVSDVGTFSFAVAYGAFFLFFTDLGVDAVATRELAAARQGEDTRIVGTTVALKSVLVGLALAIGLPTLLLFDPDLREAGAVACAGVVIGIPGALALCLNARLRVVAPKVVQVVGAAATLVLVLAVLAAGAGPVAVVAIVTGTTLPAAAIVAVLGRRMVDGALVVERGLARRYARTALPIGLSMLGAVVYKRIDQILLGAYGEVSELGRYAAAVRLVDALNIVPVAVATIALPALAHFRAAGDDRRAAQLLERAFRFLAVVFLVLAAAGTLGGNRAMELLFGSRFRDAGDLLAVLLWAQYFGASGMLAAQAVIARGDARWLAAFAAAAASVNIGIDLWAIPRFGAAGAAWASLAAYATPLALGMMSAPVRDVFGRCVTASVRPAIAVVAVLSCFAVLRPSGGAAVVLFVIATPCALAVTRSTTANDLREVASAVRDRGVQPTDPARSDP